MTKHAHICPSRHTTFTQFYPFYTILHRLLFNACLYLKNIIYKYAFTKVPHFLPHFYGGNSKVTENVIHSLPFEQSAPALVSFIFVTMVTTILYQLYIKQAKVVLLKKKMIPRVEQNELPNELP